MILHITYLALLALPCVLTYDRARLFRNRRMLLLQPHQRRNAPVPFVIRVPYSKVVPSNPLFSHSVAWKAKLPQVKSSDEQQSQSSSTQQQQPDPEITQFHSQDTNGQVVFGFNSPDQMRIETRNADGTVHGTYSYLDPYGQIIKRQYWDTGAGFHVTSNTYPVNNAVAGGQAPQPEAQYTPEVQAARDLHFQLYQQALASLLPHHGSQDSPHENNTADTVTPTNETTLSVEEIKSTNDTKPTISNDRVQVDSESDFQSDGADNAVEPSSQNGSIVIENPEYLRISWTTENKKYRINLYNGTDNSTNKVHIRQERPHSYNITKFTMQGSQ